MRWVAAKEDGRPDERRKRVGLVTAVAVLLSDVMWGNPTKGRLVTPEASAPVADATRQALDGWAQTHPDAAAALRARMRPR